MMSDCGKCWETPCVCGHEYRDYSLESLTKMRDIFQGLIDSKRIVRSLILDRPLVWIDLESTGLRQDKDRIIEIATLRVEPDGRCTEWGTLVNPGILIPPEVSELTGIRDADVADAPAFHEVAEHLHGIVKGCAIGGFNARWFDVPMLYAEFCGAGFEWEIDPDKDIVDACGIFKHRERRDLAAAVRFYLGREHVGAHRASADIAATRQILQSQLTLYSDLPDTLAGLAAIGADGRIDLDGKFVRGEDGKAYFNFGKHIGEKCSSQAHYLRWMVEKGGFHPHTQKVIRGWLKMKD
jgi:DNA polymerase III subunit epsilon